MKRNRIIYLFAACTLAACGNSHATDNIPLTPEAKALAMRADSILRDPETYNVFKENKENWAAHPKELELISYFNAAAAARYTYDEEDNAVQQFADSDWELACSAKLDEYLRLAGTPLPCRQPERLQAQQRLTEELEGLLDYMEGGPQIIMNYHSGNVRMFRTFNALSFARELAQLAADSSLRRALQAEEGAWQHFYGYPVELFIAEACIDGWGGSMLPLLANGVGIQLQELRLASLQHLAPAVCGATFPESGLEPANNTTDADVQKFYDKLLGFYGEREEAEKEHEGYAELTKAVGKAREAYTAFMNARAALRDVLPQALRATFDEDTNRFRHITVTAGSEGDEETDEEEY
ncbi:MAG: hypothetical protein IJ722_02720 [Alloprevotella sp.]|nr:hypothetical protein [Alloprevotella sp.]